MPAANIQYSTFKFNEKTLTGRVVKEAGLSGVVRVSFNSGFNTISYSITPDETILKYVVRVTKDNEDYDVDTGNLLHYSTNISPNKATNITLTVDNSTFNKGDGVYRISMYAWNGVMWDHTYLFICFDGLTFKPADSDGFEVYSDKDAALKDTITFTVEYESKAYTFEAEGNMTWDQWINSVYNTDGFGKVYDSNRNRHLICAPISWRNPSDGIALYIFNSGTMVIGTDIISSNNDYNASIEPMQVRTISFTIAGDEYSANFGDTWSTLVSPSGRISSQNGIYSEIPMVQYDNKYISINRGDIEFGETELTKVADYIIPGYDYYQVEEFTNISSHYYKIIK